jgi:hypothetical protein
LPGPLSSSYLHQRYACTVTQSDTCITPHQRAEVLDVNTTTLKTSRRGFTRLLSPPALEGASHLFGTPVQPGKHASRTPCSSHRRRHHHPPHPPHCHLAPPPQTHTSSISYLRLKVPSTFSAPLYSQADTPAGLPAAATGGASRSNRGTPGAGWLALTAPPVSKVLQPLSARAKSALIHGVRDRGSCRQGAGAVRYSNGR